MEENEPSWKTLFYNPTWFSGFQVSSSRAYLFLGFLDGESKGAKKGDQGEEGEALASQAKASRGDGDGFFVPLFGARERVRVGGLSEFQKGSAS